VISPSASTMRLQALALLALLAAVLLASGPLRALAAADNFDAELASEAPELVEHAAHEFVTLADMGESEDPAASFAELDAEQHADVEHQEEHNEAEAEAPHDEERALIETSAEADSAAEAEAHSQRKAKTSKSGKSSKSSKSKGASKPWHRDDKEQPVARNNAEITCIDGDCTRATKVKKAKIGDHPSQHTKPPPGKLEIALGAVKEEIMVRAKQLHKEKVWAAKVAKLIDEYQQKLHKVDGNIVELRVQTKALLRKKKQIQNVQVQNKLRYKLKLAQADLNRLQKQMEHIAGKENEFADTEKQLKGTMNALKNSLLKLRGQEPKRLEAEGIELP